MRVNEVIAGKTALNVAGQRSVPTSSEVKTAFEKNASKLRGKERRLNPQKPIKPVQHGP